ncbi:alpha/beta fold hydrolase [Flavobacterium sp. Sd200]|uniref:alpha/beta fold hydrolase n=1 Tax=Flavobacterium sp. Sd200 TaxID=2692211 RepID=UPI00136AFC9F|nr:alpha/beta hydrolase [Flavobacterium sp. Sd200]MXN89907.1 alpha/beta fold hydrolase [Flavobacterium sp. Sd200]
MKALLTSIIFLFATVAFSQVNAGNSKTQYANINGRQLAYRSIGSGTPIVLTNRFRGTLDTWDPLFLDNLAKTNRVITFDYTGIGYSTGTLPTDIALVAKDVKDLATHLGLKKIILGGWSYGGLVAQTAALQYPELVTHLILLGTGPVGKREVELDQSFLNVAFKPVNTLEDEIILFFEPESNASVAAAKASHDRIYKRADVSKIPSTPEVFQLYGKGAALATEDKVGLRQKLIETTLPILIICGDHDTSFAVENWYPLNGKLQNAQLIVFSKTGHAPQHQHAGPVAAYIQNFLLVK